MLAAPHPEDAVYGPFRRVTPEEVASLLDGYPGRWWVSGGWAVEAFTGVSRPHEDIDISIDRNDVPMLVRHFAGTHHVWAAGSGSMKALTEADDTFPSWAGQAWVREDAFSPWLIDFVLGRVVADRWTFKRDPFVNLPFDDATWRDDDGIVYEMPEITLLYKAKHDRPKDRQDLEIALPLMGPESVSWLREQTSRAHPGHPWLSRLDG